MSEMINIPAAEYQNFLAQRAEVERLTAARELEVTTANIRAQTAAGQVDALARSHREAIESERRRSANTAKKSELAQALAGQPILPAAAGQLTKLWSDQLHAEATTDGFAVRTASYQDVGTFVAEQLAKPEFAHYLQSDRQAAPANNAAPAAASAPAASPGQPVPMPEPKSLGEAIIRRHRDETAAKIAANGPDGRTDPSKSFGFGSGTGSTPSIATLSHILRNGH